METVEQQVSQYIEGLKPTIQDKTGVQMMMSLLEAHIMVMKAEINLQEKCMKSSNQIHLTQTLAIITIN